MLTDLSLLLLLILLNGLFALSEIAIVSSKRARLLQMADEGKVGAERALDFDVGEFAGHPGLVLR